jgi:hypothetical protein
MVSTKNTADGTGDGTEGSKTSRTLWAQANAGATVLRGYLGLSEKQAPVLMTVLSTEDLLKLTAGQSVSQSGPLTATRRRAA